MNQNPPGCIRITLDESEFRIPLHMSESPSVYQNPPAYIRMPLGIFADLALNVSESTWMFKSPPLCIIIFLDESETPLVYYNLP